MSSSKPLAAFAAVASAIFAPAILAEDDAAALRAELQSLKTEYDSRVAALEARISQLEVTAAATASAAEMLPAEAAPAPAAAASPSAFNPAISLILAGNYADTSREPGDWHMAGFVPSGDEVGPGERSFNLGESELVMSANVDPYFSAQMTAALTAENEVEVEEAFFRTLALPTDPAAGIGCAAGVGSPTPPTGTFSSCVMRCSSASTRVWYSFFSACSSARRLATSSAAWPSVGEVAPASASSAARALELVMESSSSSKLQ